MISDRDAEILYAKVSGKPWKLEDREAWALSVLQGAGLPLAMLLDRIVSAPSEAAAAEIMRRDGWGVDPGHNSRWMRTYRGMARRTRRIWQREMPRAEKTS